MIALSFQFFVLCLKKIEMNKNSELTMEEEIEYSKQADIRGTRIAEGLKDVLRLPDGVLEALKQDYLSNLENDVVEVKGYSLEKELWMAFNMDFRLRSYANSREKALAELERCLNSIYDSCKKRDMTLKELENEAKEISPLGEFIKILSDRMNMKESHKDFTREGNENNIPQFRPNEECYNAVTRNTFISFKGENSKEKAEEFAMMLLKNIPSLYSTSIMKVDSDDEEWWVAIRELNFSWDESK